MIIIEMAYYITETTSFLKEMEKYEPRMIKYEGEEMEIVIEPKSTVLVVLITHDESIVYSNDGMRKFWLENGKKKLLPKSFGTSIMISGFVCECHGFMMKEYDGKMCKSYVLFEAGTHREGWFTNDDLIKQVRECCHLFKDLHPNCELFFAFDNSNSHHKRAPDGLDASLLPLKDGGANAPIMRNTKFKNSEYIEVEQLMQNSIGQQKGLKSILMERELWRNKMPLLCKPCEDKIPHDLRIGNKYNEVSRSTACCARYCCSVQHDFKNQHEWLREVIEDELKAKIIFYPKFHCELNFIEMVWCYLKAHLRKFCSYQFSDLKEKVNNVESIVPVAYIRRAARHCFRFMDCYRNGLDGPLAEYAMKTYSSHRRVPDLVDEVKRNFAAKKGITSST
jgi:hypothetical protein